MPEAMITGNKPKVGKRWYGVARWSVEDVMNETGMSEAEAEQWLEENEEKIIAAQTAAGWEIIQQG